jgi:DNA replication licensing factor MCM7
MDDDLRYAILYLMNSRLAQHVAYVHMHLEHPHNSNEPNPIDLNLFRHYIAMAKSYNPVVSSSVGDYMVNCYVHLRNSSDEIGEFQYTCARTLLSIIRMASSLVTIL